MSVFDNRRNDVSDAIDEVYRTPAIILAADLTELSARSARLERERDEERAARLKAQAERDRLLDCLTTAHTREEAVAAERDEALGLLSKAREHWRQVAWLVPALRDAECVLTTGTQDGHLADLAKILGTGETT